MNRVIVYTKGGCPFCSLLKLELKKRNITFESVDLSDDTVRAKFYETSGKRTVPQLYITSDVTSQSSPTGISLGGYSDISKNWNVLTDYLA